MRDRDGCRGVDKVKGIVCVVLCFFVFLCPFKAEATETDNNRVLEDLSDELIDESNFDLDKETAEKLRDFDISDYEKTLENLSVDSIFSEIFSLFKSGFKRPLASALSLVAVLIIGAVVLQLKPDSKSLEYVVLLGVLTFTVLPVSSVVAAFSDALKSAGAFFASFVPIFGGLLAAKGKAITASVTSATLILVCQCLQQVTSFVVVPLCGMQLSLQIGVSFLKDLNFSSLTKSITKFSMWSLGVMSTVFLSVLGLQSLIAAPADNVSLRTLKFVAGSAVPVVGNVVSETIGTVGGCIKLLSSSAVIYAIAAVGVILLPVIVDIILWKISIFVCRLTAEILSFPKAAELLASAESCFSLCLGVTVLSFLLFTISVTVISLV